MMKNRVVVTGLGMLSPVGNSVEASWAAILAGKSGVAPIDAFDTEALTTKFSASVKGFDVESVMPKKEARKFDAFIQYGIAASVEAINDSGIEVTEENSHRIGVCIASGLGGMETIEANHQALLNRGPRRVSPFLIPGSIINMVAGQLSIMYGLRGPNISIVTACTTGVHNIGHAARMIAYGDADAMIAGGSEMATTPLVISGFNSAKALSTRNDDPTAASRPWDKDRDGFVLGDGAGVVVLESLESAQARGAKIYAELTGFGMSGDAYHMTSPPEDGAGAALAMQNAVNDAGKNLESIHYLNAHGTSTPTGDIAETRAVKNLFGQFAKDIRVSSTKSMTGHLLGAAGSVEAIFTILALRDQVAPPTINLDNPDDECDLNYVPHTAQEAKIENALCNSFGFGGTNGSLLFSEFNG
ncbi:beta-ketoacyl-ACP synthase II [Aliikangiella marina]|uniref:3-oxoacyl-[acyl-carrier-protein] synthase 2 n=1 Tax=Aliikangiella marina TaxID=1712262 RepID=A0A545TJN7_9GAMM|nr:beta-ketoacyl-ACP synthase II [Aliikangiella marina]TQV77435.1 beta-ketoacyl-ACP synthase II [Aliikangiella marina]